jgi:dTDP-4-dehydrorhamnose reductase
MSNQKILITGGSGMLGEYLNVFLSKENEILTTYNNNEGNCLSFNSRKIDLTDFVQVEAMVREFKPNVIVHTAAISRTDLCDKMPYEEVYKINSELPQFLGELSNSISAKLIYTSTDLIYDGEQGELLNEDAKVNPITVYAETKYEGEVLIKSIAKDYIILRQALMYGFSLSKASNYFQTMYDNFKEGRKTKLFYDQYRTPMSVIDSARLITKLCDVKVSNVTLNWGGAERVNRVELAEALCEIMQESHRTETPAGEKGFDKSLIEPISMDDIVNIKKVKDVSMSTEKIQKLGLMPVGVREGLREMLRN